MSDQKLTHTPLLARLAKLTSTKEGLDASLMMAQYSSPLVIAFLLSLARFRASHPQITFSLRGKGAVAGDGGQSLVRMSEGIAKAAGSIGDARVIMRAFGLLPVIGGLLRLYPKPLDSLIRLLTLRSAPSLSSPKTVPTLQVLALLAYFPLEHIAWLANKGVISLAPTTIGKAALWSVRAWALYVMLELFKLRERYFALLGRTKALKASRKKIKEAEGYELQPTASTSTGGAAAEAPAETQQEEVKALRKDWRAWKDAVIVNSGFAPLTVHWSTGGSLWTSPLVTSSLGMVAATGQLLTEWRKGE